MNIANPPAETAADSRWVAAGGGDAPPPVTPAVTTKSRSRNSTCMEGQLVSRVAQGDREAFAELYDRYSKLLHAFAVRLLDDPWEAEDVLQEVFLRIWDKARCFDETVGRPFTWAVTITRNHAIDRLRSRQRLPIIDDLDDHAMVDAAPVDHGRRDQVAQIRAALGELPEDQRRAIELAYFNGFTHVEIAGALGLPLGTIKARIRRGIFSLRDGLEGWSA